MKNLKFKKTLPYLLIQVGFYAVLTAVTFLIPVEETAEAVRVVIMEFGAFPMLCAITGWVMAEKEGFLPLFGLFSALLFIPFMLMFYSVKSWYLILIFAVLGYAGTLVGYIAYKKEVKRIEEGRPPQKKKKSFLYRLFDRFKMDKFD